MRTYPIMLDLHGRLAVVVGAGAVGLRKVRSLRDAGASVRLVAQRIDGEAELDGLDVRRQPYAPELLDGASLVFACTDDRETNARIAHDARAAGAIVNAADQPEDCDFYLPAVAADGDVLVAIGTGGSSPGLAGHLKRKLAGALPPRIGEFAAALSRLRDELKAADAPDRGATLKSLADDDAYEAFLREGEPALRRRLAELQRQRGQRR